MIDAKYTDDQIEINAPRSKVWDILTNPQRTPEYMFGCRVQTDWTIGEPILWIGVQDSVIYVKGEIKVLEPEIKLVYTVIDPQAPYADIPENYLEVIYDLSEPLPGKTTLRVRQGDYQTVADGASRYADATAAGGWQGILEKIKEIAEES